VALRECNHKRADTTEGGFGCAKDLWTGKTDLVCVLGTSLSRFCSLQLCSVAVQADVGHTDACGWIISKVRNYFCWTFTPS